MSVGYEINEDDLKDIRGFVNRINSPETIASFKIWPADVENRIGTYLTIERKPTPPGEKDIIRTGDTVFGESKSDEERKAFIGKLAAAFAVEQISFSIDWEIGQRLMQMWRDAHKNKAL